MKSLVELMDIATDALEAEDADLARRFRGGDRDYYDDVSQGLVYWVFETTLVYVIFKAWIPEVRVAWEASVSGYDDKKADLVVFAQDGAVQWVFEAKWWQSNSAKTLSAITDDLQKMHDNLQLPRGEPNKFLMLFWSGTTETAAADPSAVEDLRHHFKQAGYETSLVYLKSFATDWNTLRRRGGSKTHFAVALLSLDGVVATRCGQRTR